MISSDSESLGVSPLWPPVVYWLRCEGLAAVALSGYLYSQTGASWWLFAALWLVPDLSMLGYLASSRVGARCYNFVHSYVVPTALACAALMLHRSALLPFSLIWFNHIGADRLLGYGLKYPNAFGDTHLGRLSKSKPAENSSSAPAPAA
jgi:hypothetical protein